MADTIVLELQHIVKTPGVCGGRPRIAGRRIPVHQIASGYLRQGMGLEEFREAYDLSEAQVYAALAYYYDHQAEMDAVIQEELAAFDALPDDPSQADLRAKWQAGQIATEREMSATEIAQEYGITERAVREAAAKGWLPARKAGAIWLIARRDAEARWGKRHKR